MVINAKTGQKLYEKEIIDPSCEILILKGMEIDDAGNLYIFGNYYPKGKMNSQPSLIVFCFINSILICINNNKWNFQILHHLN